MQEWAKAPPEEEHMEMDMEKPSNGAANPNVATREEDEEEEAMLSAQQPAQRAQASANPFTGGQASNPFR